MLFSIIIPVYNVESYLVECLSCLEILPKNIFEIIAVNDGSTDGSSGILRDLTETMSNLVVVNQENAGLSAARNTGLAHSCGEYVAFIDSDDYVDTGNLQKMFEEAERNNADIAVGNYWEFDENIKPQDFRMKSILAKTDYLYDGLDFFLNYYKPLSSVVWRNIYKREFLSKNDLKFHDGVYFEDVEFTPIAFSKAKRVVYTGISFYYYRRRGSSITSSTGTLKKVTDTIRVWRTLTLATNELKKECVRRLFRELGFHNFLYQYSLYDSMIPISEYQEVKRLCKNRMYTTKYTLFSYLIRHLPQNIVFKLLKIIQR